MAKYKIIDARTVQNTETKIFIPRQTDTNPLFQEYKAWVDAGNIPDPPDEPIPVDPDNLIETRKLARKIRRIVQVIKQLHPEVILTANFDNDN